jgi:hypothetical protein
MDIAIDMLGCCTFQSPFRASATCFGRLGGSGGTAALDIELWPAASHSVEQVCPKWTLESISSGDRWAAKVHSGVKGIAFGSGRDTASTTMLLYTLGSPRGYSLPSA